MKEFDILQELEKLNDDIEPGFLSDLKQQAPVELHSRIMNSIRQEALIVEEHRDTPIVKARNRFNYRRYVTFTAAAALLVVAFLGGANGLFKNGPTPTTVTSDKTFAMKAK